MIVHVNNLARYEKEIKELARKVISGENLKGELSITFVDDDKMSELNERYTGRSDSTDVLSFPFDVPLLLGDIYISLTQANRQKEVGILSELKLLTVHGILHLAGYNDSTEEERNEMREREKEYLK
ncbi:MAG: rRNA maturation RNase YbeY [Candidatus Stahlbacteria bacterium]|jgi:rRNA maturation RNase YbeY|nr:rRNA maturation RNase YbeY [candidate division WOR-3 bacterium]TEU01040.1 MAG: rRNA maturation RNase YbeY [Candidatus Stahlbacteria bacterium]